MSRKEVIRGQARQADKTSARPLIVFLLVLVFVGSASAQERRYTLGTAIDLTGGGTNRFGRVNAASTQSTPPFFFFLGAYPSLNLNSAGAHSSVNASYSFGLNRTETGANLHSNSHNASVGFTDSPSRNWSLSLTDSFAITDDPFSSNAFRGAAAAAEAPVFNPVGQRVVTRNNNVRVSADYKMTARSSLSFSGSHALRDHSSSTQGGLPAGLSNQQQMSGGINYSYRTGAGDTWSVGYTTSYFSFKSFQNAFSNAGQVGYSTQIGRGFGLSITAGVSQTQNLASRENRTGYNTSSQLAKTIGANSLSLSYTQSSGHSTGLGAISDSRTAALSLNRNVKKATISLQFSAFDSIGRLGNSFGVRGVQGVASIGTPLTRTLSIRGGAQYQQHRGASLYAFEQKRVFVSFRYSNPTLFQWSASR